MFPRINHVNVFFIHFRVQRIGQECESDDQISDQISDQRRSDILWSRKTTNCTSVVHIHELQYVMRYKRGFA